MKWTEGSINVTRFKHIAFTYLGQKTDTSLENRAGRWLLRRGCLLLVEQAQPLVGETQATQQPNSTTQWKCLFAQYQNLPLRCGKPSLEMRKAALRGSFEKHITILIKFKGITSLCCIAACLTFNKSPISISSSILLKYDHIFKYKLRNAIIYSGETRSSQR